MANFSRFSEGFHYFPHLFVWSFFANSWDRFVRSDPFSEKRGKKNLKIFLIFYKRNFQYFVFTFFRFFFERCLPQIIFWIRLNPSLIFFLLGLSEKILTNFRFLPPKRNEKKFLKKKHSKNFSFKNSDLKITFSYFFTTDKVRIKKIFDLRDFLKYGKSFKKKEWISSKNFPVMKNDFRTTNKKTVNWNDKSELIVISKVWDEKKRIFQRFSLLKEFQQICSKIKIPESKNI